MRKGIGLLGLAIGVMFGLAAGWILFGAARPAAAGNDRYEDYILCTGPVFVGAAGSPANGELDGVWLLDYRQGKLKGTCVNRLTGKIGAWAEMDLVRDFELQPKGNVHFMMTTGTVAKNQSALYVVETLSGKMGIYTMAASEGPMPNTVLRRHDLTNFRQPRKADEGN